MSSKASLNQSLVYQYRRWLDELGYSDGIKVRYPRVASEFCDSLANRAVEKAIEWDVRRFLFRQFKRHCNRKIYEDLVALRNFFEFLNLGGLTTAISIRTVRIRAPRQDPPIVANPDMISVLIAAAKSTRELAVIELLYATGCRVGELARIKVEDIDFESRKIRVEAKFGKSRYVVFGTQARTAVKKYLKGRTSGYLFRPEHVQKGSVYKSTSNGNWVGEVSVYTRTLPPLRKRIVMMLGSRENVSFGQAWAVFKRRVRRLDVTYPLKPRPMASNTIRRILYQVALRAGLRRIAPHEFRHCCATHLLDGGADIREVQELLGHACLTTTQLYTHVGRKKLLQIFDRCHPRGDRHAQESGKS